MCGPYITHTGALCHSFSGCVCCVGGGGHGVDARRTPVLHAVRHAGRHECGLHVLGAEPPTPLSPGSAPAPGAWVELVVGLLCVLCIHNSSCL